MQGGNLAAGARWCTLLPRRDEPIFWDTVARNVLGQLLGIDVERHATPILSDHCRALGLSVGALREKGGKRHAMPCHHNLEEYLAAYLDGAGLRDDPKGPLFRTIGRGTGVLTRTVLPQANACAMIRRRAAAGRDRNQARQLQLPGDRDHRVSQEWRHTGKGRGDGEPRLNAYDAALRPPPR